MTTPDGARCPLERLPDEWEAWCVALGEPRYRGRQLFTWIQKHGVLEPAAMTNLPKTLRAALEAEQVRIPMGVASSHAAPDRTRKLLVRMDDGREVETVLIPQLRDVDPDAEPGDDDESRVEVAPGRVPGDRVTQCISSQVGCAMACGFCASGVAGLKRNMSAAEIVAQVFLGRRALEGNEHLRNVVFMGMGEPLHNYDAVARAVALLTHPDGIALSQKRVTVSTSGLVPEIDRLAQDFAGRVRLALSLHAVDDATRSAIMPINRRYPLADVLGALRRYPLPRGSRITIEYTLLAGVNDGDSEADALVRLLRGIPVKVNLIPMNPVEGSGFGGPGRARVVAFQERVANAGMSCFVRTQRGDEISAACGQLVLAGEKKKVRLGALPPGAATPTSKKA